MKAIALRFFSPQENKIPTPKSLKATQPKQLRLTGYISGAGKLVFPHKTVIGLGLAIDQLTFRVGMQEGKRKAKSLYLIPAGSDQPDTFPLEKAAKRYTLPLAAILKKSGVDFAKNKYVFRVKRFNYEGSPAFELQLRPSEVGPKTAYTGKPRGRKPRATTGAE